MQLLDQLTSRITKLKSFTRGTDAPSLNGGSSIGETPELPFPPTAEAQSAPALTSHAEPLACSQAALPETKDLGSAMAESWLRGADPHEFGPTLTSAYEQVVWVYRAINVLAEQVANIPFRFSIGQAGGEDLIQSGPLVEFYDRPHPLLNRFQYWEMRVMWLMLRGECFRVPIYEDASGRAWVGRNSTGRRLKQILFLDPAHFQHVLEGHELVGWRYTGASRNTPIPGQIFLPREVAQPVRFLARSRPAPGRFHGRTHGFLSRSLYERSHG